MYPEGWLIDSSSQNLILFLKDSASQKTTGSIQKWNAVNGSPSTFKSKQNASAKEAITRWIDLTEDGWRRVDTQFDVNVA